MSLQGRSDHNIAPANESLRDLIYEPIASHFEGTILIVSSWRDGKFVLIELVYSKTKRPRSLEPESRARMNTLGDYRKFTRPYFWPYCCIRVLQPATSLRATARL